MNNFGEFLFVLRKEKGLTQAELADMLGVTNKAVSKWETGEAMPETGLLAPIAHIFGVTADELLNGRRAEPPTEKPAPAEPVKKDIGEYVYSRAKDKEPETKAEKIGGAVCAAVMSIGVITYLVLGTFKGLWTPYWIILPVCGLSCGIIGLLFGIFDPEKRERRDLAGFICGIVMLVCTAIYLLLGAMGNLWHPYWLIPVCGALACGVIGSLGKVFSHKDK